MGLSRPHQRHPVHPYDRKRALLRRQHAEPGVQRLPGHPRSDLRPPVRARLPRHASRRVARGHLRLEPVAADLRNRRHSPPPRPSDQVAAVSHPRPVGSVQEQRGLAPRQLRLERIVRIGTVVDGDRPTGCLRTDTSTESWPGRNAARLSSTSWGAWWSARDSLRPASPRLVVGRQRLDRGALCTGDVSSETSGGTLGLRTPGRGPPVGPTRVLRWPGGSAWAREPCSRPR